MSISDRAERAAPRDYELDTLVHPAARTTPIHGASTATTSTDWQQRVDHRAPAARAARARPRRRWRRHGLGGR